MIIHLTEEDTKKIAGATGEMHREKESLKSVKERNRLEELEERARVCTECAREMMEVSERCARELLLCKMRYPQRSWKRRLGNAGLVDTEPLCEASEDKAVQWAKLDRLAELAREYGEEVQGALLKSNKQHFEEGQQRKKRRLEQEEEESDRRRRSHESRERLAQGEARN